MVLCKVCEKFDIRELLEKALESESELEAAYRQSLESEDSSDGEIGGELKRFFRHHDTILAVKGGAQEGCNLCSIIWCERGNNVELKSRNDDDLALWLTGQIYIGTNWGDVLGRKPLIRVISYDVDGGEHLICELEAFALRGQIPCDETALTDLLSREISPDSSNPACLSVGADWLNKCCSSDTHTLCSMISSNENLLPTRVIHVGDDSNHPRLYVAHGNKGAWASLSYCWGGNSPFTLTSETLHDLTRGVPLSNFPTTLKDAIIITRALGLEYLWIDALCIFQDSPEDWYYEAAKMFNTYKDATVTIIASASSSTSAGIFSKRELPLACALAWNRPEIKCQLTEVQTGDEVTRLVGPKVYLRAGGYLWRFIVDTQFSPCASRGWTMQENLLSPRTLVYQREQLVWQCSTIVAHEDGYVRSQADIEQTNRGSGTSWQECKRLLRELSPGANRNSQPSSKAKLYGLWYDMVREYTHRCLTRETDVLPGIAAIARLIGDSVGDKYVAGLWEKDILYGLTWISSAYQQERPRHFIAPSWSWACMSNSYGNINFPRVDHWHRASSHIEYVANVRDIILELTGPDYYGQVRGGHLTLDARFHDLLNVFENVWPNPSVKLPHFHHLIHRFFTEFLGSDKPVPKRGMIEFARQHIPFHGQRYAAVQLIRWSKIIYEDLLHSGPAIEILILETTGASEPTNTDQEDRVTYRRIGKFRIRESKEPFAWDLGLDSMRVGETEAAAWEEINEENWPIKTVTII